MLGNQSTQLLRVGAQSIASSSLKQSARLFPQAQATKGLILPTVKGSKSLTRPFLNGFHSTRSFSSSESKRDRRYYWIEPEAEQLIAKAYARHQALADTGNSFPPSLSVKDLESVGQSFHYEPKTFGDRVAQKLVKHGEKLMSLFFRKKYDHHAVTLETIAAVPGIVGAAHRHLRSLRNMKRDHGWINPLQEEAENERMHLLIWMQHTKPSRIERAFVVCAQGIYVAAYSVLMFISPKTAHRTVGYLEEAAHHAYTEYLEAIDSGEIPNVPAGKIAKQYYRLPEDATLRDVVLHVRADECMHRDFNHHLGDLYANEEHDKHPTKMGAL